MRDDGKEKNKRSMKICLCIGIKLLVHILQDNLFNCYYIDVSLNRMNIVHRYLWRFHTPVLCHFYVISCYTRYH